MHVRLELQDLHCLFALAEVALYSPVVLLCVTFLKKENLVVSKAEYLFVRYKQLLIPHNRYISVLWTIKTWLTCCTESQNSSFRYKYACQTLMIHLVCQPLGCLWDSQEDKGKCETDSVIPVATPAVKSVSWTKHVSHTKVVLQKNQIVKLRCFFTAVIFFYLGYFQSWADGLYSTCLLVKW